MRKRRYRGRLPVCVRGPDDVVRLLPKLRKEPREHFLVLLLNARCEVIGVETVSVGSLNASIVHPREVFKPAIVASAALILLVHNHPSGNAEPSEEDLRMTRKLVECGELLGIQVIDHVILGERDSSSLRAMNLLTAVPPQSDDGRGGHALGRAKSGLRVLLNAIEQEDSGHAKGSRTVSTRDFLRVWQFVEDRLKEWYRTGQANGAMRVLRETGSGKQGALKRKK